MNTRVVANAISTLLIGLSAAAGLLCPSAGLGQPASGDTTQAVPISGAGSQASDLLPFARNDLPIRVLGFGAGGGGYFVGMHRLDQAFTKLEDVYRSQGYNVPSSSNGLDPMLFYRMTLRLGRKTDLVGQLGRSNSEASRLRTTGVLLTRRLAASENGAVSVVAGLGAGAYGFSFTRTYNVPVSPTAPDGSYYLLRHITLEGGGAYGAAAGGLTVRPGRHSALDAWVQYLRMGDVSTDAQPAGRVSVNLSGVALGAGLTLFY